MTKQTGMIAIFALGLFSAFGSAYAKSPDEMAKEISASTGKSVRPGATPEQIADYLKAHNFYPSPYARKSRRLSGYSMYMRDGRFTADPLQAAFGAHVSFTFDERDRLKGYNVDVEKVGR